MNHQLRTKLPDEKEPKEVEEIMTRKKDCPFLHHIKKNAPDQLQVHDIFCEYCKPLGKGYELFRQVGLELKHRHKKEDA